MKSKSRALSFLFLLLSLSWGAFVFGFPPPTENPNKNPVVILRDSYGRIISPELKPPENAFGLSDSVFGNFFDLETDKKYNLSVKRDGKEISNLCLRSDENGVISTCALWWNLGFNYDPKDDQDPIDEDFAKHKYSLSIRGDGDIPLPEIQIPVSKSRGRAYVYTCDKDGYPKNTFIRNQDDIYLRGDNLKEIVFGKNHKEIEQDTKDRKLYIYIVKNRWSWRLGDRVDGKTILKQKYVETLDRALESPQLLWRNDDLEVGGYDIIVSGRDIGILLETDVIESNYGVGFKVVDQPDEEQPEEKKDIIQELACQAPPHILMYGNLDKPRAAIYKDYFSQVEEIWVALDTLNPTPAQRKARKVRIYVIKHQEGRTLKEGGKLRDESGGYEEVLLQPQCARAVFTRVWCKPGIREAEFDVVIDFNCNGRYDKGVDILDNGEKMVKGEKVKGIYEVEVIKKVNGIEKKVTKKVEHGGFYIPQDWVCLDSVTFDHTKNSICCDAITIRKNLEEKVRVPKCEWKRGKRSFPAAYVRNSSFTVLPKFISTKTVKRAVIKVYCTSGNFVDLKEMDIPLDADFLFEALQNTPNKIQSFYLKWEWYLRCIKKKNGECQCFKEDRLIATTINKIFIVLDVPQCPWTITGDTTPWTDVLDLTSQVAYGESRSEDAAKKITKFLYKEIGGCYEKRKRYTMSDGDFCLKKFLKNIPHVGKANCYDMGRALVTFSNVLGCGLDLWFLGSSFTSNCIKPMGKDWECDEKSCEFDNHAFAVLGDRVFDAALKVDSWGDPTEKRYRAAWLINIPWADYKKMLIKKSDHKENLYPSIVKFKITGECSPKIKDDECEE